MVKSWLSGLLISLLVGWAWGGEQALSVDLQAHEAQGGHTLARHTARSVQYLVARLDRIHSASTFSTVQEAEQAVNRVIQENSAQINSWLSAAKRNQRLAVEGRSGVVGHGLTRREVEKAEAQWSAHQEVRNAYQAWQDAAQANSPKASQLKSAWQQIETRIKWQILQQQLERSALHRARVVLVAQGKGAFFVLTAYPVR